MRVNDPQILTLTSDILGCHETPHRATAHDPPRASRTPRRKIYAWVLTE